MDRDEFITRSKERLDLLEAQIDGAAQELRAQGAVTRADLTSRMQNARRSLHDAWQRLDQARSSGESRWEALATDLDAAVDDTRRTARRVLEDLRV